MQKQTCTLAAAFTLLAALWPVATFAQASQTVTIYKPEDPAARLEALCAPVKGGSGMVYTDSVYFCLQELMKQTNILAKTAVKSLTAEAASAMHGACRFTGYPFIPTGKEDAVNRGTAIVTRCLEAVTPDSDDVSQIKTTLTRTNICLWASEHPEDRAACDDFGKPTLAAVMAEIPQKPVLKLHDTKKAVKLPWAIRKARLTREREARLAARERQTPYQYPQGF